MPPVLGPRVAVENRACSRGLAAGAYVSPSTRARTDTSGRSSQLLDHHPVAGRAEALGSMTAATASRPRASDPTIRPLPPARPSALTTTARPADCRPGSGGGAASVEDLAGAVGTPWRCMNSFDHALQHSIGRPRLGPKTAKPSALQGVARPRPSGSPARRRRGRCAPAGRRRPARADRARSSGTFSATPPCRRCPGAGPPPPPAGCAWRPGQGVLARRRSPYDERRVIPLAASLPLDRRRRLAADVVDHAVDALDFVDDARRDAWPAVVGQAAQSAVMKSSVSIDADGDHVAVGAGVAHHADASAPAAARRRPARSCDTARRA